MALADQFIPGLVNCAEALAAGSCLLVGNIGNCGEEPPIFFLETDAAQAVGDESVTLSISSVRQNGGVLSPAPASVTLRDNAKIYFNGVPATVTEETVVSTGTNVPIEPLTVAVAAGEETRTWGLLELEAITDLPINADSTETDRQDLKSGIQGQNVKTRVDLNIPVTYFSKPENITQRVIMTPAAIGTEDIYFVAVKNSGLVAFGRAKVFGQQESGAVNSLITVSTTLNAQAPFGYGYLDSDPRVNSTEQLVALNTLMRLSGLDLIT